MPKKILVIGNGGREHAICDALARSPQSPEIFNFGSAINPGIKILASEIHIEDTKNPEAVVSYAQKIKPNFVIVGPEDPLAAGVSDALEKAGIPCFGPSKKCAQLESSKGFTRNLLKKYNIDASPEFQVFEKMDKTGMRDFYKKFHGQIVLKADGLIGGKGVLVAGEHFEKFEEGISFLQESIEKFGRVVLEEKLVGEEFSFISVVDGKTVLPFPVAQDHKRAFEGDMGPNTGGMGCVSDEHGSLPFLRPEHLARAHEVTELTMKALEAELGERYIGVMYGGFMLTARGVKLIEFNARFGDPEALNILPVLQTDFVDVCEKAIAGKLIDIKKLRFEPVATVVKYLCPEGYPTNPVKNMPIVDHQNGKKCSVSKVFFASVGDEDGQLLLKGSRAIGILGTGKNIAEANKNCEVMIKKFSGPLFYRKDIGTAKLMRKRVKHMREIVKKSKS